MSLIFALYIEPTKAPNQCFGFEWKECQNSPLDILEDSTCPVVEEQIDTKTEPVRIELDDSLLKSFNELSEDELEFSFGKFTPVQSLNPYMTKMNLCSITEVGLKYFKTNQFACKCCLMIYKLSKALKG